MFLSEKAPKFKTKERQRAQHSTNIQQRQPNNLRRCHVLALWNKRKTSSSFCRVNVRSGWNVNKILTGQIQLQCQYQSSMSQEVLFRNRRHCWTVEAAVSQCSWRVATRSAEASRRCVLPVGYCQRDAEGAGWGGAGHAMGAGRSSHSTLATPTVMAACAASVKWQQNDAGPATRNNKYGVILCIKVITMFEHTK